MNNKKLRRIALEMIHTGVEAADPERLVRDAVKLENGILHIADKEFTLDNYEELLLFGIGKASVSMASAFKTLNITDGLLLTNKNEHDRPVPVRIVKHPYPDETNLEASKELLSKLKDAKNALIIFLISGGGSSMFTVPAEGISIEDINDLNRLLVTSGMDIGEINTVRKHVSQVKGGRLAQICEEKGTLVGSILSDVVGDDISNVASGPTCADSTTYKDAFSILKEWDLWRKVPANVSKHLKKGLGKEIEDTPKVVKAINILVGNNMTALEAMKKCGGDNNIPTIILTSENIGEAKEVAKRRMDFAKKIKNTGSPHEPPVALVMGGEMTVKLDPEISKEHLGGPNREFVLSAAMDIQGENIVVASADSDGIDGSGKAGAIANGDTIKRSSMDAMKCLNEHRSQEFFDTIGDSIEFSSKTNVNDLTVIIVGKD